MLVLTQEFGVEEIILTQKLKLGEIVLGTDTPMSPKTYFQSEIFGWTADDYSLSLKTLV